MEYCLLVACITVQHAVSAYKTAEIGGIDPEFAFIDVYYLDHYIKEAISGACNKHGRCDKYTYSFRWKA
jgi:hypothetical protein